MEGEVRLVDDVAAAFASLVADAYGHRARDRFAMAFSGGATARACYERLAVEPGRPEAASLEAFWGDERCVPLDDPDSNHLLVHQAILDRVGPVAEDHPMDCGRGPEAYEQLLRDHGPLDLVHLGLGPDGHTASLFPGTPLGDGADDGGRLVATNVDPLGRNVHPRMTLTFSGIAYSRLVVVTVAGDSKRDAFAEVRAGGDVPAARLRAERLVWLVDPPAAGT